jgi:hypothetical protein
MGRVHVARHHREKVNVFGAQGANKQRGVAHGDLVKCPVLDEIASFGLSWCVLKLQCSIEQFYGKALAGTLALDQMSAALHHLTLRFCGGM